MATGYANELFLIWTCDVRRVCESTMLEREALVYLFHLRIVSKPVSVWNLSTIQLELKLNAHIYVVVDDGSTKDVTVIKMFRFEFVTLYKYRVSSFWVFGSNYDVLPFLLS